MMSTYSNNSLYKLLLLVVIAAISLFQLILNNSTNDQIVVAVIDTSIVCDNEKIEAELWVNTKEMIDGEDTDGNGYIDDINGYNFVRKDSSIRSGECVECSHGTICSTLIIDTYQNSRSDKEIRIMPLIIMESSEEGMRGSISNLEEAILYAENNGADICNLSLSSSFIDDRLETLIRQSSMLFVVSAGDGYNRGTNIDSSPVYPASIHSDNMLVVNSIMNNGYADKRANYGENTVDIAANGSYVCTDGSAIYGTSFAAARVSGFAAAVAKNASINSGRELKKAVLAKAYCNDKLIKRVKNGNCIY